MSLRSSTPCGEENLKVGLPAFSDRDNLRNLFREFTVVEESSNLPRVNELFLIYASVSRQPVILGVLIPEKHS